MSWNPIRAVIFDWAGTTVDFGCFAPVAVFVEVFRRRGVAVTAAAARGPMGLEKRDHIRALAALPEVAAAWLAARGRPCGADDIEAMYADSVPLQAACVADYAEPVPGAVELAAELRARGVAIGSTTGYSRPILEALLPAAAARGFAPDAAVCPSDVPAGRPYPWMAWRAAMLLGAYPPAAVVKVGDTLPDILEGRNAGMWSVGVTLTGNELGLTRDEAAALPPEELARRQDTVAARLREAGAHYVVPSVAELPAVLDDIARRLAAGERP